jgi:hypothetical protein
MRIYIAYTLYMGEMLQMYPTIIFAGFVVRYSPSLRCGCCSIARHCDVRGLSLWRKIVMATRMHTLLSQCHFQNRDTFLLGSTTASKYISSVSPGLQVKGGIDVAHITFVFSSNAFVISGSTSPGVSDATYSRRVSCVCLRCWREFCNRAISECV